MPSIHRQPGRPFLFCEFTLFDPETHTSKRVFHSTKTRDKKQALEVCRSWHKAALFARNGKLSADAAREVITRGVSDVYAAANLESLESATVRKWCEKWLEAKSIEAEESTQARYKRIVDRFLECLGAKANRDLSTLQAGDITRFRDREAKTLSRATANLSLKVLRVCFGEALRQGLLALNPAVRVPVLKSRDKSARRAFTLSEIKRILKACGNDAESVRCFGRARTRDCRSRERRNLAAVHAPFNGRSAQRHAAVAGRNKRLIQEIRENSPGLFAAVWLAVGMHCRGSIGRIYGHC